MSLSLLPPVRRSRLLRASCSLPSHFFVSPVTEEEDGVNMLDLYAGCRVHAAFGSAESDGEGEVTGRLRVGGGRSTAANRSKGQRGGVHTCWGIASRGSQNTPGQKH